jgi:ABC-2 type transport system permease protein
MTTQAGTRPSAARGLGLIVRRELGVYFGSRGGWLIAAILLLVMGLLFNADAVGTGSKYSADVLADFFKDASGVMMVGAILVSMRLLAEERQAGTLPLLLNSSLTEGEIVLAKFLSAWLFLSVIMTVGAYMPLLIFVRGKVSLGHLGAGYLGLYLLGAASVAIGTFGSAVARSQVVAAVTGAAILVVLLLVWMLARLVDGALGEVVGQLALWDKHFTPFMRGTIALPDVLYYLSVTTFFLVLARNGLESRRWSS